MDLNRININSIIDDIFQYHQFKYEVQNKIVNFEFSYTTKFNANKLIIINDSYNIGDLENVFNEENLKRSIFKKYVFDNITQDPLALELIFKGVRTYDGTITPTKVDLYKVFSSGPAVIDSDERLILNEVQLKNFYDAIYNFATKLGLYSYPLTMFTPRLYDGIDEVLFNAFLLKNDPKGYEEARGYPYKEYLYLYGRSSLPQNFKEQMESFFSKPENLKKLDNPLLKKRAKELDLYVYEITGYAYKSDGWETWKSDIEHFFVSNIELDTKKLLYLYENEFNYEVKDFIGLSCDYLGKNKDFKEYNSTFIELYEQDKYITRNINDRFKLLKNETIESLQNEFER